VDLQGLSRLLALAASSTDRLQDELALLLMRLCVGNTAGLKAICGLSCQLATTDSAGAPAEQHYTGLQLLQRLLCQGSELTRACACGILGCLALHPVATDVAEDVESDGDQQTLLRTSLMNDRTLDVMLEVLFDVTTLLVRRGGWAEGPAAAPSAVSARARGQRGSAKTSSTVRKPLLHGKAPRECKCCARVAAQTLHLWLMAPRRCDVQETSHKQPEADKGLMTESLQRLRAAQAAAVQAIVNMSYGHPPECCKEVCKALAKALKAGSPAKKLAATQVAQHTLAHAFGRATLCNLQVIPCLVSLCATGAPASILHHRMLCSCSVAKHCFCPTPLLLMATCMLAAVAHGEGKHLECAWERSVSGECGGISECGTMLSKEHRLLRQGHRSNQRGWCRSARCQARSCRGAHQHCSVLHAV
jgi:hypothetical protein